MSTTTRPRSPPGYLNQIRTPKPDAPMLHRLNCLLLNELNSDIQPNYPADNPRSSHFFDAKRSDSWVYRKIYGWGFTLAEFLGSMHPDINSIEVMIDASKGMEYDDKAYYYISAVALGRDSSRPPKLCAVEDGKLDAVVRIQETGDQVGDIPEWENRNWAEIVRLLRRAGKITYDSYGEERTEKERRRMDGELDSPLPGGILVGPDNEDRLARIFEGYGRFGGA
jgi:hypothetical protein